MDQPPGTSNGTKGSDNPGEDYNDEVAKDLRSKLSDCVVCANEYTSSELVELPCQDLYCRACIESVFSLALKDETAYPPRCCIRTIPLNLVSRHLPKALVREFKAKELELRTKDKTYCHKPTCSAFIAPHSIHNGEAICQKCNARTCSKCRAKWHFGPCSAGDDPVFTKFADSKRLKRCPQCRRMIEKDDGCNYMV